MIDFFVLEKGAPSNPAVLCIHGLFGASRNLYRLVEGFSKYNFYAIAYDQRGHGHSSHALSYTLEELASDALKILKKKKIQKAHWIGHSLGGRVALEASLQNPSCFQSLTLMDVGTQLSTNALNHLKQIIDLLPDFFNSKLDAKKFLKAYLKNDALETFFLSSLRSKQDKVEWIFDLKNIRENFLKFLIKDHSQAWKNIHFPTLILRGENSSYFSKDECCKLLDLNPGAQLKQISNAGHWLHVDNFEDTLQTIVSFIKGVTYKC